MKQVRLSAIVTFGLLAACGGAGSPTVASSSSSSSSASTSTTMAAITSTTTPSTTTTSTTSTSTTPATTSGPAVVSTSTPSAREPESDDDVQLVTPEMLGTSWREGCPVGPDQLRMLTVRFVGFDGLVHQGQLVVNASAVAGVRSAFQELLGARFPIRKVVPVDAYGSSDDASMADDNTSAFNCREAVRFDGVHTWSVHAYGLAIDVNPVENPYVDGQRVLPPNGAAYTDRSDVRPGMAGPGSALNQAFAAIGWGWGGAWNSPDYQHFSATGR
jgi:hypothetical protein